MIDFDNNKSGSIKLPKSTVFDKNREFTSLPSQLDSFESWLLDENLTHVPKYIINHICES